VKKQRALVVDDEPDIRELLGITLERMNIEVVASGDVADATRELRNGDFDLCFTDMRLPDGDGLDLVQWIQKHRPQTPVAVITAHGNVETAVRALKLGAFDFISKPLDLSALRKLISATLKLGDGSVNTVQLPQIKLLGRSQTMDKLRELIERVSRSQAPVHIYGESGTGKELVAQLIHEAGARRDASFVPVNCGAIPNELMESELFGHKKGSFTGAIADKQGLIQSAEGGTLFLDEIADMSLKTQAKVLRALQEQVVEPVGGTAGMRVDVRVLAATNKDLTTEIRASRFREDLYFRLNVIPIFVPPLRERPGDIPLLAQHFMSELAVEYGRRPKRFDAGAATGLQSYRWPGNVRELRNVIERLMIMTPGDTITASDLSFFEPALVPPDIAAGAALSLHDARELFERDYILRALSAQQGNISRTADMLGVERSNLYRKMRAFGIAPARRGDADADEEH
jgi:DNA-binding NtrC family response regulator